MVDLSDTGKAALDGLGDVFGSITGGVVDAL